MDDDLTTELLATHEIEILLPDRDDFRSEGGTACRCCGSRSFLDQDGCGICDECLDP